MLWTLIDARRRCSCVDAVLRVYAQTRFLLAMNLLRLAIVAALIGWSFMTLFGLRGAVLVTLLATAVVKTVGGGPDRAADAAPRFSRRCRGSAWPSPAPARRGRGARRLGGRARPRCRRWSRSSPARRSTALTYVALCSAPSSAAISVDRCRSLDAIA